MTAKFNLLQTTEIIDEAKLSAGGFSQWLAATQQFNNADVPCGSCNACCRSSYFIHIRPDENDALQHIPAELLFAAPGLPQGHVLMGFNEHGACPMLVDGHCSIYAHRPQTCRDYDCRIFAATNVAAGESEKAEVNRQAQRWRFDYPDQQDRLDHEALHRATIFLLEHGSLFEHDILPTNATQLALLAIRLQGMFLQPDSSRSVADTATAIADIIKTSH